MSRASERTLLARIGYDKMSKALVLLIAATSLFMVRHVVWVVTNPDFYTSIAGAIWIAGVIPFFLVVIGCGLFLTERRNALALIVGGGVLSFFGTTWSYIPFLPALSADPVGRFALLITGNSVVLGLLIWTAGRRH